MFTTADLSLLYIGYFNRLPDQEGLAFWQEVLASGFPLSDVAQDFSTQAEAIAIYEYFAPIPQGSPVQFLNEIYQNLFSRPPDAAGFEFWTDYISNGERVGDTVLQVINSAAPADQATLDAKLELAEFWCGQLAKKPNLVFSDQAVAASRNALAQSGTDVASQAEALDDAALYFAGAPALDFAQTIFSLSEAAITNSRTKVGEIAVYEATDAPIVLRLAGPDSSQFEVIGTEVFLKEDAALDFETSPSLSVTVEIDDPHVAGSPDDTATLTISIRDVLEQPDTSTPLPTVPNNPATVVLSNTVADIDEDADVTTRTLVADINVNDDGRGTNTLALAGADAALFEIDGTELFLRAGATLDFETNATLDVSVTVDDVSVGTTPDNTAMLAIAVSDVNEIPSVGLTNTVTSLAEDADTSTRTEVADIVVSDDVLGTNNLALSGADAALFEIDGTELFLRAGAALDFDTNPALDVSVTVDDISIGTTPDDTTMLTIAVSDFLDVIELSDIELSSDTRGFVMNGVSELDFSGISVSSAGDVDGDGLDDVIIGAYRDDPNGGRSGASFVVFGKADGTAIELSDVEAGTGGFVINGVSDGDLAGISVSSAGDVDGDGLDDLIVGAYADDPNGILSGASFVVFGKADGTAIELSDVEAGTGGFVINGVSDGDRAGISVSSAGDVDGDGLDDLIVGAYEDDPNGLSSGASFVVFGKADGTAIELSDVEAGTGGFVINGVSAEDMAGSSVSSAGDVNGDGLDDVVIGANGDDPNGGNSGASFVVFGKADGTAIELSDVEAGTGGFVINGIRVGDRAGISVSSAGDVDGDGLDDLIVGAHEDDPNGGSSGASFVVFGKSDSTAVELSDVEAGTGGFVMNGVSAGDRAGFSVSSAGDVDGDGLDDLIVGARFDDPNGNRSGASFVVFGKSDSTAVELSDVEAGMGGFVMNGVSAEDFSGNSVSSAGDVNGDGFDDLIIGAFSDDPNGEGSGASFVVFGGDFTGAATEVGSTASEAFTGSAGDDNIFAGQGDDTLSTSAGIDRLSGAEGADTFIALNVLGTTTLIDFSGVADGAGSEGDQIDVSTFAFADFATLQATFAPEGPGGHDTRIALDGDTALVLLGVESTALTAADFILT